MPKRERKGERSIARTGYFGVETIGRKYRGYVYANGQIQRLGMYKTAKQAAKAYDAAAIELGRPLTKLNFPEQVPSGYIPCPKKKKTKKTKNHHTLSDDEDETLRIRHWTPNGGVSYFY